MPSKRQRKGASPKVKRHRQTHLQTQIHQENRQPQQLGELLRNLVIIPLISFKLRISKIIMKTVLITLCVSHNV
eukprot:3643556-Ditylum_brightwellii.AAC.1